ncbi:MAG: sigma-70 family RNA polymerase sigma factor [Opitutus sp.]|nr:sigma-70 family RNA polymerase sigma factor [Opitutus sp.]
MEAGGGSREAEAQMAADAELMRRVQDGDEAAFGALMETWEVPVKRLLARIVVNAGEAEELAQETFVRVWQQREKFRDGAAVRPWVFSIAVNLARNRLRWWRRRPSVSLQEWDETPEAGDRSQETGTAALEMAERAVAVREAVAGLPVELREAIVLFEYEEMSHAEIAVAVGASAKAVESRVARAREKLRVALKRWV